MTNPESINLSEKGLYIKNKHITNVVEVLRFSQNNFVFYHITFSNGYYENYVDREVYVTRTPINKNGGSTWDYLCKLAAETGLTTEDDESILSKQYETIDIQRDNVPLAQYLGSKKQLWKYYPEKLIIYPFGCNASQKDAVEKALTNQVSIIQGPPGTGKTQTILNIIANLLMVDKTVLVVSNNNSAVDNVAEKLEKENLRFIVAKLGSVKNKEEFIANQPQYPDMSGWLMRNEYEKQKLALNSLQKVTQSFDNQMRQALLNEELEALQKEMRYNEMLPQDCPEQEWLYKKKSSKIMKMLNLYQMIIESGNKPPLWFRIKWAFKMGIKMLSFLNDSNINVTKNLEAAYYLSRKSEIEDELDDINSTLQSIDIDECIQDMRSSSLELLKNKIAEHYHGKKRSVFSIKNIKQRTEDFLQEYPVVLSTTYSARTCISSDNVFDYVIMDEASQVDIKTGALALSCATNAVIVGDDKQLPNVISREEALALNAIQTTYKVDDRYNAITHSFLQSCSEVFKYSPVTLLREHYRCHPKIIEFCNQRFYNGELVAMTTNQDEKNVLKVVFTAKGNHARGHFNQREIDVIKQEIIPTLPKDESVGIITPYHFKRTE